MMLRTSSRRVFPLVVLTLAAVWLLLISCATAKFMATPFPDDVRVVAVLRTANGATTDDTIALDYARAGAVKYLKGGYGKYAVVDIAAVDKAAASLGVTADRPDGAALKKLADEVNADAVLVPAILELATNPGLLNAVLTTTVSMALYDRNGARVFENEASAEEKKPILKAAITGAVAKGTGITTAYTTVLDEAVAACLKPLPRAAK